MDKLQFLVFILYNDHKNIKNVKCVCGNLKKNLLSLLFIGHDIIHFLHNRHFRLRPQCAPPAGRPPFSMNLFGERYGPNYNRTYSDLPAVHILNFIHKAAAAMWPLATIFL